MSLEVSGLSISIDGVPLVEDVSFSLAQGDRIGMIGESGSGKSLTALALTGLLPSGAEVTGSVRWNERELIGQSPRDFAHIRGREIGMVFQDPSSALNPIRTIGNQIGEPLRIHYDLSRAEVQQRVLEAVRTVGLPDPEHIIGRYPHELSGGQRQRAAIAAAIITGPRLIIADEPTTALDVTVQAGIIDAFAEMVDQLGSSLIFVTHDIALLSTIVHNAMVLAKGAIVETGSISQLLTDPQHPVTAKLVEAARATSWTGGGVNDTRQ